MFQSTQQQVKRLFAREIIKDLCKTPGVQHFDFKSINAVPVLIIVDNNPVMDEPAVYNWGR